MGKQVTDISETLQSMASEMRAMREKIDSQYNEICRLNRNIDALHIDLRQCKESNAEKDKQIAELKERLAKYETPDKNSGNSSTPPSKEKMKAEMTRRTKTLRKQSGRKPGGQAGHEGSTLRMTSTPDLIEEDAASFCTACGHDLSDSVRVLDHVTQVICLPEFKPIVREIRHYATICKKCGKRIASPTPRGRGKNSVEYDTTVKAIAVFLSVVMFLPYGRIETFFAEVCGLHISQGSIDNWIRKAKKNAAPAIKAIGEYLKNSRVVGFDESGCYCNKKPDWAWIAQTVYFTLLFRASGRGSKVLEDRFGDALQRMVAVTDRHSAYFVLNFLDHQVCLAHLLRELQYLSELNQEQDWSEKVATLFREAIHTRNENPDAIIEKKPFLNRLDELLKASLTGLQDRFEKLQKGLIKCRDYIFNFLECPEIPPDNNASENGIRKLKIKLKNSCTFRSELGADAFLELHSIVETAKKHNQSAFQVICALC